MPSCQVEGFMHLVFETAGKKARQDFCYHSLCDEMVKIISIIRLQDKVYIHSEAWQSETATMWGNEPLMCMDKNNN